MMRNVTTDRPILYPFQYSIFEVSTRGHFMGKHSCPLNNNLKEVCDVSLSIPRFITKSRRNMKKSTHVGGVIFVLKHQLHYLPAI